MVEGVGGLRRKRERGGGGVHWVVLIMEAVRTSETSVYSNGSKRRYIPEVSHLQ
jgi:hypothetical protein